MTPNPDFERPIQLCPKPLNGRLMTHEKTGRLYQVIAEGTGTEDNEIYVLYIPANYFLVAFIRLLAFLLRVTNTPIWVRTKDNFTGLNSRQMQRFLIKK